MANHKIEDFPYLLELSADLEAAEHVFKKPEDRHWWKDTPLLGQCWAYWLLTEDAKVYGYFLEMGGKPINDDMTSRLHDALIRALTDKKGKSPYPPKRLKAIKTYLLVEQMRVWQVGTQDEIFHLLAEWSEGSWYTVEDHWTVGRNLVEAANSEWSDD